MTHASLVQSIDVNTLVSSRFTQEERRSGVRVRLRLQLHGVVQGVGFRPFVHRIAERLGLCGFVRNNSSGVEIEGEGSYDQWIRFFGALLDESPPLAEIQHIAIDKLETGGEMGFHVVDSKRSSAGASLISPDVATCGDCLHEMNDPADRRFRYPFINCTNCGPRFTIIERVPYDRANTTMRDFELCPLCAAEYANLPDRRYHAEPAACAACGPRVKMLDGKGECIAQKMRAIEEARRRLREGDVIAVKGLGGFHLACDAACAPAVSRIRQWKGRPDKPFAVMCRDLDVVRLFCRLSAEEERVLTDAQRPILLLARRNAEANGQMRLAEAVAPLSNDLGVMLPYTPLHHLLFGGDSPGCLVMTSGNCGEEPMVIDNEEAVKKLNGIAAALLVHDRAIWNRCDDSVGFMRGDQLQFMRRSRGFVPLPVYVERDIRPTLAMGAMLNNTFALAHDRKIFLSQHIGDVENIETLLFLRDSIHKYRRWLGIDPDIIAHDLHPDLLTTHLAGEMAGKRRAIGIQHHHAHFAAALTDAGIEGEAQGWVLDGTGWGPDRTVWGGELLVGSVDSVRRAGHLRTLPMPGGEAAIKRPLRLAAAYLHAMLPESDGAPLDLWQRAGHDELTVLRRMIDRRFNTPMTSSAGRLFDAVAALLGVRDEVTYEGQAAIELEQIARSGRYNDMSNLNIRVIEEGRKFILDPRPLFEAIVERLLAGDNIADMALGFHHALAGAMAAVSARIRDAGGPAVVVLCGGVFQNRILIRLSCDSLRAAGLQAVIPQRIPVNDGGLVLGQVMIANAIVQRGEA